MGIFIHTGMKRISYLDMIQTLLPESEFEAFKHAYDKPIKKSIKILNIQDKAATKQRLEADGWTLTPPDFS